MYTIRTWHVASNVAKKQAANTVKQELDIRIGEKKSVTSQILIAPPSLKARKVSMSLYPADQDRIREVQRSLLGHGVQVSDSEALRLVIFFRHFQS